MRLPTYTSIWRLDRRLYKIEDWVLPVPISLLQGGVFLGAGLCWWVTLHLLGVGFTADTGWLYLVPPAVAAWAAGKPVAEDKRAHELVVSQLRYCLQPRTLLCLEEVSGPARLLAHATVWARPDTRHPLPPLSSPAHTRAPPPAGPEPAGANGNGHPRHAGDGREAGRRLRELVGHDGRELCNGRRPGVAPAPPARPPAGGRWPAPPPRRPDARSPHDAP